MIYKMIRNTPFGVFFLSTKGRNSDIMKKKSKGDGMNTKKLKILSIILLLLLLTSCSTAENINNEPITLDLPTEVAYDYEGKIYTEISGNVPEFSDDEITTKSFEKYEELDYLGRCQGAFACIGQDIMPTEERGAIGQVKPSGWQLVKYDNVDGKYLYNRCHLIAYQLTGENANEKNLITGTRYMNTDGMLPFENIVADYVKETNNHVMYRVTPVFEGQNLLAKGVKMEAFSVEDDGAGVCFNVFVFNIQPGIKINYANGASEMEKESEKAEQAPSTGVLNSYILNVNSKKIHYTYCSSVEAIKEKNKKVFKGTKEELIDQGYTSCGRCCP